MQRFQHHKLLIELYDFAWRVTHRWFFGCPLLFFFIKMKTL